MGGAWPGMGRGWARGCVESEGGTWGVEGWAVLGVGSRGSVWVGLGMWGPGDVVGRAGLGESGLELGTEGMG